MLSDVIKKVILKEDLTVEESKSAMDEIMSGQATPSQLAAFLVSLRMKGETIDEITGCAMSMRNNALRANLKTNYAIDTCGTGGDGGKTFNISTAASIIAAAAGNTVAKHGNRAVSSKSGSADVLSELGFNLDLDNEAVEKCINEVGLGFLFAPKYHLAMKNVAPIRKELGIRTIFNLLGPITNPAFVKGQIVGVYHRDLVLPIAHVLSNLGCEKALVVHGSDGLDEITTTTTTYVAEVKDKEVFEYILNPADYGIDTANSEDISGSDAKENAQIILDILKGAKGPKRDIVVLNAGAALYIGKSAKDIAEGVKLAQDLIDSGKAYEKLKEIVEFQRSL